MSYLVFNVQVTGTCKSPDAFEPKDSQSSTRGVRFCRDDPIIIVGLLVSTLDKISYDPILRHIYHHSMGCMKFSALNMAYMCARVITSGIRLKAWCLL